MTRTTSGAGRLLLVLATVGAPSWAAGQAPARDAVQPLVIGETSTVDSRILGERSRINVYAPAAYHGTSNQRFPVPRGPSAIDFLPHPLFFKELGHAPS